MGDNTNNPFSGYSAEDQASIAEQLRTVQNTGRLNPAQMQGINRALSYLPMSKGQSNSQIQALATGGMGAWRPSAPSTPFEATPQADLEAARRGVSVSHETPNPRPDTVQYGPDGFLKNPGEQQRIAAMPLLGRVAASAGPHARQVVNDTQELNQVNERLGDVAGKAGGDLGAFLAPSNALTGDARPVGRAIGSTLGRMAADPVTYATMALPESKFISGAFAGQMTLGAAQGVQQLHEVWGKEDVPYDRKLELGTNIAINALMAGVAGTHSIKGFLDSTALPTEAKVEIQKRIEAGWIQQDGKLVRRDGAAFNGPTDVKDAMGGLFAKEARNYPLAPDTTVQPQTPGQRDALSSLTGRTGPRAVNPEINSRLHPEGTTLNPFVTREPEGRIPLSPGDANNARSAGFGSAVFTPQTRGIPAAGEPPITGGEAPPKAPVSPQTPPTLDAFSSEGKVTFPMWEDIDRQKYNELRASGVSHDDAALQTHEGFDDRAEARELRALQTAPKGKLPDFIQDGWLTKDGDYYPANALNHGTVAKEAGLSTERFASDAVADALKQGHIRMFKEGNGTYNFEAQALDANSKERVRDALARLPADAKVLVSAVEPAGYQKFDSPAEADKWISRGGKFLEKAEDTIPPVPKKGEPVDLRGLSDDARHDWKSKNGVGVSIAGATSMSDARARLATLAEKGIVPSKNVTSEIIHFIDKDGQTKYVAKFAPKEAAPTSIEVPKGEVPLDKNLNINIVDSIQKGENRFNDLTKGAHKQVLQDLWNHVEKSSPAGTPKEAKMARYAEGLEKLVKALNGTADVPNMLKAFDAVTKKGEGGFVSPFGKRRLSDSESKNLAKLHADTVLSRWEALDDNALKGTKVAKKLSDPALKNSVYGAGDPSLESRYANLLERADKARFSDPILSLGTTLSGHDFTAADVVKGQMRESRGAADRSFEQRKAALKSYRDAWKSRPIEETIQFISAIEGGDINSIPDPTDRAMAQRLRDLLDAGRDKIQALGRQNMRTQMNEFDNQIVNSKSLAQAQKWELERGHIERQLASGHTSLLDKFYDTYFPHLWRYGIKDAIADVVSRRRPLATSSFLKQRTYQTFAEGMAAGMEPVTYNPVDMVLLKLHEMDRFATAHETFNQLKDMNLAHIFSPREVPYGWEKVQDGMFNAGSEASWYMPRDAAGPLNRYMSPGLRGNLIYDSIAHYNNLVNAFNLGLSFFHGTATAITSIASRFGLGALKVTRFADFPQNLKGFKDIALSPFEPVMAPLRGRQIAAEYMSPGKYAEYAATADAVATAGGRIRMPEEFRNQNIQAFRNAWKEVGDAYDKGNYGKMLTKGIVGSYRTLGAMLEATSIPLMEKFVPLAKLGVFHNMAEDIMERLPGSPNKMLVQKEFDYAWDRVDDRMGQVVYDNLFWNRTAKDMAHLVIRAVGWNYGDVRELGGAVWDLADRQNLKNAATGKGITGKQGFVLGLLATTATMGYLMNHAFGQKVDEPIDLLYPKNGRLNPDGSPQRVYNKTYVHDAYNFARHPIQSGADKLAPVWHQIEEMYTNADYYGTQIHPVHATFADAVKDPDTYIDSAKYMMQNPEPFSYRNFQQRKAAGESTLSALGSTVGILPAPKWVGETPATSQASAFYKTFLPQSKDSIIQANMQRYHELASGYEAKRFTAQDITAAWKAGQINAKQYDGILDEKDGQLSPLQRMTKPLYPHQFLKVWDKATMQEKDSLSEMFFHKWDKIETTAYSSDQAAKYTAAFNTAWKQYRETKSKESKSN